MSLAKKIAYNREQSEKYEWLPEWFGANDFDEEMVNKIKEFQISQGLSADGMCGPSTYRRIWTERASEIQNDAEEKYIVHNSQKVKIHWDKVILWNERGGQESKRGNYRSQSGLIDRKPRMFVTHWDVCLSSKSCASVLNRRGLSVHYLIDNDGTIFQCLDTQHIAYHAGSKNKLSIGVEISNAYSLKYQSWYKNRGFGPRPIWKDVKVHGKGLKPFLGFYDIQLKALAALWEAISRACDIPLQIPNEPEGYSGVSQAVVHGTFSGFGCHYHITKRKIDCAGLNLANVLKEAKELKEEC